MNEYRSSLERLVAMTRADEEAKETEARSLLEMEASVAKGTLLRCLPAGIWQDLGIDPDNPDLVRDTTSYETYYATESVAKIGSAKFQLEVRVGIGGPAGRLFAKYVVVRLPFSVKAAFTLDDPDASAKALGKAFVAYLEAAADHDRVLRKQNLQSALNDLRTRRYNPLTITTDRLFDAAKLVEQEMKSGSFPSIIDGDDPEALLKARLAERRKYEAVQAAHEAEMAARSEARMREEAAWAEIGPALKAYCDALNEVEEHNVALTDAIKKEIGDAFPHAALKVTYALVAGDGLGSNMIDTEFFHADANADIETGWYEVLGDDLRVRRTVYYPHVVSIEKVALTPEDGWGRIEVSDSEHPAPFLRVTPNTPRELIDRWRAGLKPAPELPVHPDLPPAEIKQRAQTGEF